jgi:hypothetical protein
MVRWSDQAKVRFGAAHFDHSAGTVNKLLTQHWLLGRSLDTDADGTGPDGNHLDGDVEAREDDLLTGPAGKDEHEWTPFLRMQVYRGGPLVVEGFLQVVF